MPELSLFAPLFMTRENPCQFGYRCRDELLPLLLVTVPRAPVACIWLYALFR